MVETAVDHRDVLVEAWVGGVDLRRVLAEHGRPGLPVATVLRWTAQAAELLSDLHQNGRVHGGVQPANLVLDQSGRIVLLGPEAAADWNGQVPGPGRFRAPEVAAGAAPDSAADVYGLAATTFVLLTGAAPTGEMPTSADLLATQTGGLESTLRSGLAVDPADRPATPNELVERLGAAWDEGVPTDGPCTALVTDLVDSSPDVDDELLTGRLALLLAVDHAVEQFGGRRSEAADEDVDATSSLFTDAANAVRAAVALNRELQQSPESPRVKAGLASGELDEASSIGSLCARAAQVRDLAEPGQILLEASTGDLVRSTLRDELRLTEIGRPADGGGDGVVAVATFGVNSPADPSRSPYPGLAAFGQNDSDLFFGREQVIEHCLDLLRSERFVALVGESGSGKSSVLQAGLGPRVPHVVVVRPGDHPLRSLAEAGAPARPAALLVVDQLDEVVTLCQSQEERAAFIDAIVDHPGGLAVALRAEHYGEFAQFAEFAQLMSSGHVLLGSLDEDELSRAVVEPAHRCGMVVEDGLTELIAGELGDAPGVLPKLSHALRETWLRRDGRTLTVAGYRETGGVQEAIAETAERTYGALGERDQAVARRLFGRMVELRPEGDVSRWVDHNDLGKVDPVRAPAVLSALTSAGLIVTEGSRSAVAHDAVLSWWPRLTQWIAETRATLVLHDKTSRDRTRIRLLALLLVGASLVTVAAVVAGVLALLQRDSAEDERDAARFAGLVADARAAATELPDSAMLLAVEARAKSTTPGTTGILVDALVAQPSVRAYLHGAPSAVQAMAAGDGRVVTAAGHAVQVWNTNGWQQTGAYSIGDQEITDLALSEDGQTLVAVVPDARALVAVNTRTGQPVTGAAGPGRMRPISVATAGDSALVLADDLFDSSAAPRVEQLDLRTLEPVGPVLVPPQGLVVEDLAVSEDGDWAALATSGGGVWLADLVSGDIDVGALRPVADEDVDIDDLAWHADLLVAGRVNGGVDAWRAEPSGTLTPIGHFEAGDAVRAVAAGCDGSCLAAGTAGGRVVAWRIGADQVPLDVPNAHDGRVNDVEITADGNFVVSAGVDRVTTVHALDGSSGIAPLAAPGGAPAHGAYGMDDVVFSGTDDVERGQITRRFGSGEVSWRTPVDGAVRWLAATESRVVTLIAPTGEPMRLVVLDASSGGVLLDESLETTRVTGAVSPDGSVAVLAARTGLSSWLRTVDLGTLSVSDPIRVGKPITAVSFAPDGSHVVTGHATGDIAVRGLESFTPVLQSAKSQDDAIAAVAFTPDGQTVIAGGRAGLVHVLDAVTMESRYPAPEGHHRGIRDVAANEQLIVTTSDDGTLRMWDAASGAAVGGSISSGGTTAPSIAMNSDGTRALVQGEHGLLELIVNEEEWVRLACSTAGRELSEDERTRHGLASSTNACSGSG